MSGGEHLGNASAQIIESHESVVCGNVDGAPSGKDPLPDLENVHNVPSYSVGALGEGVGNDGSIIDWNLGDSFGENSNLIQNLEANESVGMGFRMSNCSGVEQYGGELNYENAVINENNGKHEESFLFANSENDPSSTLEERNHVIISDVVALPEQSVSLMQNAKEEQVICHGSQTCGERFSPNCRTAENQHLFGAEKLTDVPLEEKLVTEVSNDTIAKQNPVEDSWKNDEVRITLGEHNHGTMQGEQSVEKERASFEVAMIDSKEKLQITECNLNCIESTPVDGAQQSSDEDLKKSPFGVLKRSSRLRHSPISSDAKCNPNEKKEPISRGIIEDSRVVVLGMPANFVESAKREQKQVKVSVKKRNPLQSSVDCARTLRSKSLLNSESSQPSSNVEDTKTNTSKRGRKKKSEVGVKSDDEYAKMRKHLRYLLHRIHYEQNLLDAYSSEGWRGQSVEKLRPEKELQRAKADINRSKLKIRDLFQRLDSKAGEGKFPESLYDSEGLIDSEDIFCAKCGSKDLHINNDIILCDGACERGFHQYCLEPPLRTEEIPPGDEGWLCPACDCRADCLDLLNDSQGTKLCIEDGWQKVFPEATASVAGSEHDIAGLPSDDSDDNDYNPDGIDDDAKVEASESSSDKSSDSSESESESDSSNFSSASEDLGAVCGNDQQLQLPSDDSEDDDYDPDAANVNEDAENESSTSDFSSASEDLGAAADNVQISDKVEQQPPLSELDQDTGDLPSVCGRRHMERLDYKKLYDETYGNAPSDSSEDEEWADMQTRKRKSTSAKKGSPVSSNVDASVPTDGTGSGITQKRGRGRKKSNPQPQAENGSPAQMKKPEKVGSSGKSVKRPPYQKLGEVVTQRLYESFKEEHYPDRGTKEKLAKELGLTPERVDKWFGNARWSFNHQPARLEARMVAAASHSSKNAHALEISPEIRKTKDDQPIGQSSNKEASIEGSQTAEAQQGEHKRRKLEG